MVTATATLTGISMFDRVNAAESIVDKNVRGKVNHSVCRWCYNDVSLDDLCKAARKIGIASIELVGPEEWPTLKKYDLT